MLHFLLKLWHLPWAIKSGLALCDALEDVRRQRNLEAKDRLVRIMELSPAGLSAPAPLSLTLALVYLRLGEFVAASEMAQRGIRQSESLRFFINPTERANMAYAGKLIYQRATQLGGAGPVHVIPPSVSDRYRVRYEVSELVAITERTCLNTASVH